jgi:tRNA1Val (adenine37-N6)-methyltransferase
MMDITTDRFFNGALTIRQDRYGYRFSIDSVILAGHIQPRPADAIVDLGTGCGIIALILALYHPQTRIYGIEIQKQLAELALENVILNRMENQIKILCGDVQHVSREIGGPVDQVVCNPPYRPVDSGRVNPNSQRAVARHEIKATLADIIGAARSLLKPSGVLTIIYPASRTADLIFQMRAFGIEPKWIRLIHSYIDAPAKLILVRGVKGAAPELKGAAPLIIYEKDGKYTEEVSALLAAGK